MPRSRNPEATGAGRSEPRALLAAAKADHWDDGPRLALAAWLEGHGGESDRARAEAIRLQLDTGNGGPDWALSVEKFRQKHIRAWVGPQRATFARKMPECARGLLAGEVSRAWLDSAPDADAWPWVEEARFWGIAVPRAVVNLLAAPRLATVPRLDLGGPLEAPALRAVGAAMRRAGTARSLCVGAAPTDFPAVAEALPPGLAELRLGRWWWGSTEWGVLAAADAAEGLSSLGLDNAKLTDAQAALLAGGRWPALRRLSVENTKLTEAGLATLGRFPLTRLEVVRAAFDGSCLARLADSACQPTLEELRLYPGRNKEGGVPSAVPALPRLRRLALCSCGLGTAAVAALARSSLLQRLEELDLSHNQFGEVGLASLLGSGLQTPRTLLLSNCALGDAGVARLAARPGLVRVRRLSLSYNLLGDDGLRALADSPHASALEALELDGIEAATPAGLAYLLRSPACARLRWLSLVRMLKPRMAAAVGANAPASLRELRRGTYRRGEIDLEGLARLRAELPGCVIG